MFILIAIHLCIFSAIFWIGLAGFYYRQKRSFWVGAALTVGTMGVLALPASLYQAIFGWPGITGGQGILTVFVGFPFNCGGWTLTQIFEHTVEPLEWLVGHRSATVVSNIHYYWALLFVQCVVVAALGGTLYRRHSKATRVALAILAVVFLINSIANVGWFWGGS